MAKRLKDFLEENEFKICVGDVKSADDESTRIFVGYSYRLRELDMSGVGFINYLIDSSSMTEKVRIGESLSCLLKTNHDNPFYPILMEAYSGNGDLVYKGEIRGGK